MKKIQNILMLILALAIIILVIMLIHKGNNSLRADETKAKVDRVEIAQLAQKDSSVSRVIKNLKDSILIHKKRADYWMALYKAPLQVTKAEEQKVFKSDSSMITREVIKGTECDSLQRNQALEINSFARENTKMDSLIKIKNKTISRAMQLDSINKDIEKDLRRKIRNRTLETVGFGILALLAIIFHI